MRLDTIKPFSEESREADRLMRAYAAAEKVDLYGLMRQSRKNANLFAVYDDSFCGCVCLFPFRSAMSAICLFRALCFMDQRHRDGLLVLLKERFPQYELFLDIKIYE